MFLTPLQTLFFSVYSNSSRDIRPLEGIALFGGNISCLIHWLLQTIVWNNGMKISYIFTMVAVCGTLSLASAAHAQTGSTGTGGTGTGSTGSVSAGSDSSTGATTSSTSDQTRTDGNREDRGPNLSWIGLLGLAGLAGLMKKPQREVVHQTDVRTGGVTPNVQR